ncbi:hypothetical protein ACFQ10_54305 [Streptomyces indonesiensis]
MLNGRMFLIENCAHLLQRTVYVLESRIVRISAAETVLKQLRGRTP